MDLDSQRKRSSPKLLLHVANCRWEKLHPFPLLPCRESGYFPSSLYLFFRKVLFLRPRHGWFILVHTAVCCPYRCRSEKLNSSGDECASWSTVRLLGPQTFGVVILHTGHIGEFFAGRFHNSKANWPNLLGAYDRYKCFKDSSVQLALRLSPLASMRRSHPP